MYGTIQAITLTQPTSTSRLLAPSGRTPGYIGTMTTCDHCGREYLRVMGAAYHPWPENPLAFLLLCGTCGSDLAREPLPLHLTALGMQRSRDLSHP
ncbi:MAG: hypothetical protein E6Q97_27435 [Desulfurellales bacterium]|nr:MAG: hypothetical protein E6Q97_27435 [Desulfurellales bacterium]